MRIKTLPLLILVLLSLFIIESAYAASYNALTIPLLELNQDHTLLSTSETYDSKTIENRLSKFHFRSTSPYVSVYKFNVLAGEAYTLKTIFTGDGNTINIELLGENPYSKSLSLITYSGLTASIPGYTGAVDRLVGTYTYKSNFTIEPTSTGMSVFMIVSSAKPGIKVTAGLYTPAESNETVQKKEASSGGMVYTAPLKLTKMPDETQQLKLKIDSLTAFTNGEVESMDVAPILVKETTMVPLRFIGEKLGAKVVWTGNDKKVTYTFGKTTIELWIGKTKALVNGIEKTMPVAPILEKNRTLVPLRFVSENLGAFVQWFETQEILITY